MGSISGATLGFTKGTGSVANFTGMEYLFGQTDAFMKDNMSMMSNMAKVYSSGLMGRNTKESGLTENSTERVYTEKSTENSRAATGRLENELFK